MPNNQTIQSDYIPRLIAWEVTRRCHLKCRHCRAGALDQHYTGELTTGQCRAVLDNIATLTRPIIILTGGEPMLRDDIYEIARHGHELGMRMVMAPCGGLVNDQTIAKMRAAGIECISLSLDGATAARHDEFRNTPGAFDSVMAAAAAARAGGLAFQINTTICRDNLGELEAIMNLAGSLGAITFNPFLLVPTGRGAELSGHELTPEQYEETLQWLAKLKVSDTFNLRVTCGPQYQRIIRQKNIGCATYASGVSAGGAGNGAGNTDHRPAHGSGCMGGKSFAFISHTGSVQICGFLDISAGQLKDNDLDFATIWRDSEFLRQVRDVDSYKGKCGVCHYRHVCGGCRARANAVSGDYLGSEPMCLYDGGTTGRNG